MDEFFMAVTANVLDDDIVQSVEKTMGEKIKNKEDALVLMDLYNEEEFAYFVDRFKYVTGKTIIVLVNPKSSSCTLYRYGYPDKFEDIRDAVVPAIEEAYNSMTGETLHIIDMIDKRKELERGMYGNLN